MSKPKLRSQVASIISSLSNADKQEQSQMVLKQIVGHPKYVTAKRLSIYLSTDKEIDTRPLLEQALEVDGKRCFIPFVRKPKEAGSDMLGPSSTRMHMVELVSIKDYEELPLNHYGIREPRDPFAQGPSLCEKADPLKGNLDLAIVPGVAFARLPGGSFSRLGHGKGYYDEFLCDWARRSSKRLYTIGLAFKEQMVIDTFAVDGHDYPIDEVLFSCDTD